MVNSSISLDEFAYLKFGLKGVKETVFQTRNLLIGKNGAGKTRFLMAMQTGLRKSPKEGTATVILDFSTFHLSGGQETTEQAPELPDLYDVFFMGDTIDFADFLNLVDRKNENFISDIITAQYNLHSANTHKRIEAGLAEINKLLTGLIGYQIHIEDSGAHRALLRKVDQEGRSLRQAPYSEMISIFSPGERFIFYLCFFLYYVNHVTEKKLILLMDEPELHLHPQALLQIMRWLYDSDMVKELWTASHSLFLVSIFEFQELVFFENGCIMPRNSKMYGQLYDDLVGLENIDTFEFLKSLDNWQYYRFLVECFCLPAAVSKIDTRDEQYRKFLLALPQKAGNRPTRILDYGAGKFRIWECLQRSYGAGEIKKNDLVYEAYEPYPDSKAVTALEKKYGSIPFPLYQEPTKIPEKRYDAVILMNVLHEIDILEWEDTFSRISSSLLPNGVLILLEVQTLSLGEQPYGNTGYLILGDAEVHTLFCCGEEIVSINRTDDKSNCWIVPRAALNEVHTGAITSCLEELKKNSRRIVEGLFQEKVEFAHRDVGRQAARIPARKYAFWSQQYMNAVFARARFDEERSSSLPRIAASVQPQTPKLEFPGLVEDSK